MSLDINGIQKTSSENTELSQTEEVERKKDRENTLLINYVKNIIPMQMQSESEKYMKERGQPSISEETFKIEIDLTPEEQWQTINDILGLKDIIRPVLKSMQKSLLEEREKCLISEKEKAIKRREIDMMAQALGGYDEDYIQIPSSFDPDSLDSCYYVKKVSEKKSLFDYYECIKLDARAELLIRKLSTIEEKLEAIKTVPLFDITRERLQQEINQEQEILEAIKEGKLVEKITGKTENEISQGLKDKARAQSSVHVSKKKEHKSLKERLAQLLKRNKNEQSR